MSNPIGNVTEGLKGALERKDYTTTDPGIKGTLVNAGEAAVNIAKNAAVVGGVVAAGAVVAAAGAASIIPAAIGLNYAQALPGTLNTAANALGIVTGNINPLNRNEPGEFSNKTTEQHHTRLEKLIGYSFPGLHSFLAKKLDIMEAGDPSTKLRNLHRFAENAGAKSQDLLKQLDTLKENFFARNSEIEAFMYQNNPVQKAIDATKTFQSTAQTWKYTSANKSLEELHTDATDAAQSALLGNLMKALEPIEQLPAQRQTSLDKLKTVMDKELNDLKGQFFELSVDQVRDRLVHARSAIEIHLKKVEKQQLQKIEETFSDTSDVVRDLKTLGVPDTAPDNGDSIAKRKADLIKEVRDETTKARKAIDDDFNRRLEALAYTMSIAAHEITELAYQRNKVLDGMFDDMEKTPFLLEARIGESPDAALKRLNPKVDPNTLGYQQTKTGTTFGYDPDKNSVQIGWGIKTSDRDKVNDLEQMIGRIYSAQVLEYTKEAMADPSISFDSIPSKTSLTFNVYAPTEKEARMLAKSVVEIACLKGIPMKNLDISYTVGDEQPKKLELHTVKEEPLRQKVQKLMQERDKVRGNRESEMSNSEKMVAFKSKMLQEFYKIDPDDPHFHRGPPPSVGMAAAAV